jgi:CubicO group peptidase (beta-lactamase class C family)
MTKSILNALIGIRVRQGKLSLNRTALFPEWCVAPDERCNISVLQLLQMSSGLHFDETYGPFSGATQMLFANTDIANYAIHHKYGKGNRSCMLILVRRQLLKQTVPVFTTLLPPPTF